MKFGMRSAVDVVFKTTRKYTGDANNFLLRQGQEWAKGEPVLYFDSLKMATTEGEAETTYAQGGKGNPRLIAWEGDKTVTFTFEDALISTEGMSILTGADLIEAGESNVIRVHKKAVVNPNKEGEIDLTEELNGETLVEESIFGFVVGTEGEIIRRLGLGTVGDGNAITFSEEELAEKDYVLVDYYIERTEGVQEVSITPDKFAGSFYIEGDTLFRRQTDGRDIVAQIVIPNAKIQTAFEFSMSPEGDPSTFTFTADAMPGLLAGDSPRSSKKMYAMRMLED